MDLIIGMPQSNTKHVLIFVVNGAFPVLQQDVGCITCYSTSLQGNHSIAQTLLKQEERPFPLSADKILIGTRILAHFAVELALRTLLTCQGKENYFQIFKVLNK